jgi:hypothetical protein
VHAQALQIALQQTAAALVQLAVQQPGIALHHGDPQAQFVQRVRRLQPQQPTAGDHGVLCPTVLGIGAHAHGVIGERST